MTAWATTTMKTFISYLVLSIFLFTSAGAWAIRVAVVDFDNKTPHGGWKVGRGAADMLATELVKKTKLEVFERDKLAAVMKEQDLGASGRFEASTAAQLGKIIGVQYIVTGSVTEYGDSKQGAHGKGLGIGKKGYNAAVDIRIVNTETGQIVFAESGEGSESSISIRFKGIGGGEKFNQKKATKAMREAIDSVAKKIARAKLNGGVSGKPTKVEILIADVDGNTITLNKGSNAGLSEGNTLSVQRKGKVIKDPSSGKVLKVKYNNVGKIKLKSVESGYSEGTIVSGSGFQVGDRVSKN